MIVRRFPIDYASPPLSQLKCAAFVDECNGWLACASQQEYLVRYPESYGIVTVKSTLESLARSAEYQERLVYMYLSHRSELEVGHTATRLNGLLSCMADRKGRSQGKWWREADWTKVDVVVNTELGLDVLATRDTDLLMLFWVACHLGMSMSVGEMESLINRFKPIHLFPNKRFLVARLPEPGLTQPTPAPPLTIELRCAPDDAPRESR